jgi:hypothetical protein
MSPCHAVQKLYSDSLPMPQTGPHSASKHPGDTHDVRTDGSMNHACPSLIPPLFLPPSLPPSLLSGVRIPPMIELGGWFSTGDDLEDMTKVCPSLSPAAL